MKKYNHLYLVGNAHLDPVWQWNWQEGSAEAKATVRSALDRMKEFPEFRFVCSSASVYQWVEDFAPEMFEELKLRVKEGRFVVVGGMHVQPDCNLPGGEAFARQSLYAQRYFKEKLGVTARIGYCVDSFGHNLMLPQILKKSGMDSYIFMRPGPHENALEHDLFNWKAPDGSVVTAYRILDPYCFNFDSMEQLEARLEHLNANTSTDIPQLPVFYGVGNHGGGPTIRNLQLLRQYAAQHPELEFTHSNLTDFFDAARAAGPLPEYHGDLQHHAAGCYAAVSHVKKGIRRSEMALTAAESSNMLAGALCGKRPQNDMFHEAWKNICFLHFHDSMGGCSIKEVHNDAAYMYGMALNIAAVQENSALQTISWAIDTSKRSLGLPVVVFNPHGFDVEQLVQINRHCGTVVDAAGAAVPSQLVHAGSVECTWRKDTVFRARVPALGYAVYYVSNQQDSEGNIVPPSVFGDSRQNYLQVTPYEQGAACATSYTGVFTANNADGTVLENEYYRLCFEHYSGYITSFVDKRTGRECIIGRAAVPLVIDEYYHDTWSHAKNYFTDVMARFSDATVTVAEFGPLRAAVKVVSRYNASVLTQYFSLEAGSRQLTVKATVDWHEKFKMLKMAWPMQMQAPKAYYEVPFGVICRPADGEEEPGLAWTAVKGTDAGWALLNTGTYSSSVKDGIIYHTVLRSPIYGDHGGPRSAESEFTEQGCCDFDYVLMPVEDSWAPVIRAARQLNKPLANIIESWHTGSLTDKAYGGLHISAPNVMLSAIKRSEDGAGLVLRLYETDGKSTPITVSGGLLPTPLQAVIGPWSVHTWYLADGADSWKEVLFTEYDS